MDDAPKLDPDMTVIPVTNADGTSGELVLKDVDAVTERPDGRLFVRKHSVFPWGVGQVIEPKAGTRDAIKAHPSFQKGQNSDGFATWQRKKTTPSTPTWRGKAGRFVRKLMFANTRG